MQAAETERDIDGANATIAADAVQYLRFALGAEMYAIGIDAVREILKVVQMTELPLMPDFVRGVMNLRGAVVPVIDLSARLGLHITPIDRRTCIVIVEVGAQPGSSGQILGMLVDAVHEVVACTPAEMEAVPALGTQVDPDFLIGMARVRGQIVPVLDIDRTLELDELAQLIANHPTH